MVEIIELGNKDLKTVVTCKSCKSKLGVLKGEWKEGEYGSERVVTCPACGGEVIKPGTDYTGDF